MISLSSCPACNGKKLAKIAEIKHEVKPIRSIQDAGWNVILQFVLHLESVVVDTFLCKHCRHIFLNPTYSDDEINRLYSPECTKLTKEGYRESERASGRSWAEQNGISDDRQKTLLSDGVDFRQKRIWEIIQSSSPNPDRHIEKLCDVGGMSGELIATIPSKAKYVFDKDLSPLVASDIIPLDSEESYEKHGPYNVLILSHVLEHVPCPVSWITTLSDSLCEDGRLYVEVPLQYCGALIKRHPIPIGAHVNYFSAKSLLACLRRSGFQSLCFLSREIVPYGELRMPVIKAVASKAPSACGKFPRTNLLIDLIRDLLLTLRVRKKWYRL